MKNSTSVKISSVGTTILSFFICLLFTSLHAQESKIDMGDRFQINKDGSYVTFEASYSGFPIIRGSIKAYQATIFYDPNEIEKTSATIRFGAASISTAHDKRDKELAGASFLDSDNFPGIWFQGMETTLTSGGFDIVGTLNIKDVNKQAIVHVEKPTVIRKGMGGRDLMMMKGELVINRKDFKLGLGSTYEQMLGDEIAIEFHFLCSNYTLDYLEATYIKEIAPGKQHPVGILYKDIKQNGLKSGKKKMEALVKDEFYSQGNWPSILSNLAWILMVDNRADEALEFYDMALKMKPGHLPSLLRMGDAYVIGGHHDKALDHYKAEYELEARARFTHIPHMIHMLGGSFNMNGMK
ncbi:MAG: YceI family protein [Bacteroidota bacterium]